MSERKLLSEASRCCWESYHPEHHVQTVIRLYASKCYVPYIFLWIRLEITRARRVGPSCYEIGGELIEQNSPSDDAFEGLALPTTAPV